MGKVKDNQSLSPNNKTDVYIFDLEHKRDSFIVVAQLSPEFTGRLVDRWMELEAQQLDVKRARHEAASSYKVVSAILEETRRLAEKDTKFYHYVNEAKLMNWALTGHFTALDRDNLDRQDLDVLARLEERNACLIGMGMTYQTRKQVLREYADQLKTRRLK